MYHIRTYAGKIEYYWGVTVVPTKPQPDIPSKTKRGPVWHPTDPINLTAGNVVSFSGGGDAMFRLLMFVRTNGCARLSCVLEPVMIALVPEMDIPAGHHNPKMGLVRVDVLSIIHIWMDKAIAMDEKRIAVLAKQLALEFVVLLQAADTKRKSDQRTGQLHEKVDMAALQEAVRSSTITKYDSGVSFDFGTQDAAGTLTAKVAAAAAPVTKVAASAAPAPKVAAAPAPPPQASLSAPSAPSAPSDIGSASRRRSEPVTTVSDEMRKWKETVHAMSRREAESALAEARKPTTPSYLLPPAEIERQRFKRNFVVGTLEHHLRVLKAGNRDELDGPAVVETATACTTTPEKPTAPIPIVLEDQEQQEDPIQKAPNSTFTTNGVWPTTRAEQR